MKLTWSATSVNVDSLPMSFDLLLKLVDTIKGTTVNISGRFFFGGHLLSDFFGALSLDMLILPIVV